MEEVPRRTSLAPLASPCFALCLIGVETEGLLDYQGRAGDHFHCAVEPSPGHIRCRKLPAAVRVRFSVQLENGNIFTCLTCLCVFLCLCCLYSLVALNRRFTLSIDRMWIGWRFWIDVLRFYFTAIRLIFFCFSLQNLWRFQARDSGNCANSRFCAAKVYS